MKVHWLPRAHCLGNTDHQWKVRVVKASADTGVRLSTRSRTIMVQANQVEVHRLFVACPLRGMALGGHLSDTIDHGGWEEQRWTVPVLYVSSSGRHSKHTAFLSVVRDKAKHPTMRVFGAWDHTTPKKKAMDWLLKHIANQLPLA